MSAEHPRLDELRRRVDKDPASIAFVSLAEELRRAGEYDEAVRVCRAGLEYHPTYLSARVTLGRALLELGRYPEAQTELEYVLKTAPDNLLALKCMTELTQRAGTELTPGAGPGAEASPRTRPSPEPPPASATDSMPLPADDPAVGELEKWRASIQADRTRRAL
jgi:tetratricopeptide (TPR) repeat protein